MAKLQIAAEKSTSFRPPFFVRSIWIARIGRSFRNMRYRGVHFSLRPSSHDHFYMKTPEEVHEQISCKISRAMVRIHMMLLSFFYRSTLFYGLGVDDKKYYMDFSKSDLFFIKTSIIIYISFILNILNIQNIKS